MNARAASLGMIAALMPLAVDIPPDTAATDGSATRVRVAAGVGTYAFIARGCEGQVIDEAPARFTDVGVAVEQQLGARPVFLGVRGGWVRHEISKPARGVSSFPGVPVGATVENVYANPYVSLEGEPAGAGLGVVFHRHEFITAGEGAREQAQHPNNDVSGHLRFGRAAARHFTMSWMEGVPLSSGGGYFTALLADPIESKPPWVFHIGLGAGGPQEGAGLVLRLERVMPDGVSLDVTGRVGFSGSRFAGGAAIGLTSTYGSGGASCAAPAPPATREGS